MFRNVDFRRGNDHRKFGCRSFRRRFACGGGGGGGGSAGGGGGGFAGGGGGGGGGVQKGGVVRFGVCGRCHGKSYRGSCCCGCGRHRLWRANTVMPQTCG